MLHGTLDTLSEWILYIRTCRMIRLLRFVCVSFQKVSKWLFPLTCTFSFIGLIGSTGTQKQIFGLQQPGLGDRKSRLFGLKPLAFLEKK